MAGKFAFGWTGHGKCKVIDSKQVKKLEHGFVCMPPDPNVGTASGKPLFALCKANKGRTELMVFATLADCREEYETQAANAD